MKRYNFDRVIDRSGTQAKKLLQLPKGAPDDVLSLWIADMDFACADPILEALHRRIDEGIFGYTQYKTPECMAAITGWFFRRFGWEIDPGMASSSKTLSMAPSPEKLRATAAGWFRIR